VADREFEREHILPEQEARVEIDAWEEPIADWLNKTIETRVQVCQIGKLALGFNADSQIGTADQRRIARVLHRLGWRRSRDGKGRFFTH
jgi:hypothetical protein